MKHLITIISIALAFMIFAEESIQTSNGTGKRTKEQKAELLKKVLIAKGGNKIAKPGTQHGKITVINTQSRASQAWIAASVSYLIKETNFNIELKKGKFNQANLKSFGGMTIYIIDAPELPRVVVAPDDCWAYCNVAQLYTKDKPFFEARVKKMVARTFAMLCGGMSSSYTISLAGPMPNVTHLDVLPNEHIPIDVVIRMNSYMEAFGITPAVLKPYRIACQEGWAPAPTNDVQKIIWDEVRKLPAKPIQIKFDPKRGK